MTHDLTAAELQMEADGIDYLLQLAMAEKDGACTTTLMGPHTALMLLTILDLAARAPGPDRDRRRQVVDVLAGQVSPHGVNLELVDQDLIRTTETMRQLVRRENAGERMPVKIGPFTAMMLIGMLQLATRHPENTELRQRMIRSYADQFAPLFTGTFGEQMIRMGWDPGSDWLYPPEV